jgi:hypothetical protein
MLGEERQGISATTSVGRRMNHKSQALSLLVPSKDTEVDLTNIPESIGDLTI